eukprot:EG_transcript_37756
MLEVPSVGDLRVGLTSLHCPSEVVRLEFDTEIMHRQACTLHDIRQVPSPLSVAFRPHGEKAPSRSFSFLIPERCSEVDEPFSATPSLLTHITHDLCWTLGCESPLCWRQPPVTFPLFCLS